MSSIKNILTQVDKCLEKEVLTVLTSLLNKDLSYILAHQEHELSEKEEEKISRLLKKLEMGYPLAYLIKEQYFYSRPFLVSQDTLIPRPESEEIIDQLISKILATKDKQIFIDIGTGTGALIISIAKELEKKSLDRYQTALFLAGDISAAALKIATKNAKALGLSKKIVFKLSDLAAAFLIDINSQLDGSIFIMANLPYLTPKERSSEPSIRYEPDLALIGGPDGLSLYRRLLKQLKPISVNRKYYLIMEINPGQADSLIKLCQVNYPQAIIQKKSDFRGQTRFIVMSNF